MDGKSFNIIEEKLNRLKEVIPEAFSEDKIDWEKLRAALGDDIEFKNERYVLNWAGKSDAFRVLQSPTTATLAPCKEESVNFDDTENIFIEGENLEVLKILQKSYFGKIKMIYIDPPYNTGNDTFIYPDKFSETKEEYLSRIGDKDETGFMTREGLFRKNSKDSGHYHSNWLSMMYPRLFLARNLLRDDGVIFVSIDDNEVHNLRLLMNEVFGEENFVAILVWRRRASSAFADNNVSTDHEYVVCFQKGSFTEYVGIKKDFKSYKNPDNDPRGDWVLGDLTVGMNASMRPNQAYDLTNPKTGKIYPYNPNRVWAYIPSSMQKLIEENRIVFPEDISKRPMMKRFKNDLKDTNNPFSSLMNGVGLNTEATKQIQNIMDGNIFEYSKPLTLNKTLIEQVTSPSSDIILDFFAGSCTTAHAVLSLNKEDGGKRKFICVQLPEKCAENSEAFKSGYKTIAEIGKERIRRVIQTLTPSPSPLTGKGEQERQDGSYTTINFTSLTEKGDNEIQQDLFAFSANPEALSERGVFKYNPKLTERARELRKNSTPAEKKIWDGFLKDRPDEYKFLRQKPIGNYILDFYCSELLLAVEIDGKIHETRKEYDAERDNFLNKCGIRVIRIPNNDVENNFKKVKQDILTLITSPTSNSDFPLSRGIEGVGFKVFKLRESNFKIWRSKIDNEAQLVEQLQQHLEPLDKNAKIDDVLYELLLKSGIPLTAKIEEKDGCFVVNDNEIALILVKVNKNIIKKVIELAPRKVITLDRLFNKNDRLKTNTALQMKDSGIEFKAV